MTEELECTEKIPKDAVNQKPSKGVEQIEALSASMSNWTRAWIFASIFLLAYAYRLDSLVRRTYEATATAAYSKHTLLTAVNVLRGVMAAVAQPTLAKLMDVIGRFQVLLILIACYLAGTIVIATSSSVQGFAGGSVIYQVAWTGSILLCQVLVGDLTSLRNRVLASFLPAAPFIINCWISGDVTQAVLGPAGTGIGYPGWRWGIGMFAVIYFVCAVPLLLALIWSARQAKKIGFSKEEQMSNRPPLAKLLVNLFWQLDIIGIILLAAALSLILVPFTIAKGNSDSWQAPHIIVMLVVGICCIPMLIFWQTRAPFPLIPLELLKNRGVWAALLWAATMNGMWWVQGSYLYTVLVVAVGQSTASATRIANIFSFSSVVTGIALGFAIRKARQLKIFIVIGVVLFMVAFALLIRYRGGLDAYGGIIAGEIVLGIGGGFCVYPTQASIQSNTKHEHLAIVTALYFACYSVGQALGSAIAGAIWSNLLPSQLAQRLADPEVAAQVYASPFLAIRDHPMGSIEREAIITAYGHVQRLLCITCLALCVPLLGLTLCLRNHRLTDEQSLGESGLVIKIHSDETSMQESQAGTGKEDEEETAPSEK